MEDEKYVIHYTLPAKIDFIKLDLKFVEDSLKVLKEEERNLKIQSILSLCLGCKVNNCYRLFTCKSWPNSLLYAIGPNSVWFDGYGNAKQKEAGNYTLQNCLEYCKRSRNPWTELKNMDEVKRLYGVT